MFETMRGFFSDWFKGSIFIFFICLIHFFLCGCQHDSALIKPRDARDAYVGKYAVHQTNNCYGPCDTCHSEQDLILVVDYGHSDSTLLFENREIPISAIESYYAYHYSLSIGHDSLHSSNMSGGLGCGIYIVQEGVRIDKNPH
jgi:hypothetical protein